VSPVEATLAVRNQSRAGSSKDNLPVRSFPKRFPSHAHDVSHNDARLSEPMTGFPLTEG
jgi:hypothetical protein